MMLRSKDAMVSFDARRIVPRFALPQSCKIFGKHGAPAPLFPHILRVKKSVPLLTVQARCGV